MGKEVGKRAQESEALRSDISRTIRQKETSTKDSYEPERARDGDRKELGSMMD